MWLPWVGLWASEGAQQQKWLSSLWEGLCAVTQVSPGRLHSHTAGAMSRHKPTSSKANILRRKLSSLVHSSNPAQTSTALSGGPLCSSVQVLSEICERVKCWFQNLSGLPTREWYFSIPLWQIFLMPAYGDISVMAPSDSYHNLIQTHIAFTIYFSLPFWLVTANSRLKFYLNESIFAQWKNITLCHLLNSSHYCVGSVAFLGQLPGTQFVKSFKGNTAIASAWKNFTEWSKL